MIKMVDYFSDCAVFIAYLSALPSKDPAGLYSNVVKGARIVIASSLIVACLLKRASLG